MTKDEAVNLHRQSWLDYVKNNPQSKNDRIMFRADWCCYVDALSRNGEITDRQANIWTCPRMPK